MKRYTTLYFDLDNTLFDFNKSEKWAIKEVLELHGLPSDDETAGVYSAINKSFWERFERGEIPKDAIFEGRFKVLIQTLGVSADSAKMSQDYFERLREGAHIFEGAEDILQFVKQRGYKVYITTNGVARTQYNRIAKAVRLYTILQSY